MEKIRYCPKGCHITDKTKDVCPECGGFMRETREEDKDKIINDISLLQKDAGRSSTHGRYVNYSL